MKTALIMEGGAMRGMFTCGVTDVFLEANISFDAAAGISAGACFGCNFKSKQAGRAIRYNKRYSRDPRFCSLRSLVKTGDLYGTDFCPPLNLVDIERFDDFLSDIYPEKVREQIYYENPLRAFPRLAVYLKEL